jgi:hypothetical protein
MCGKFTAMLSWDDVVFLEAIANYPVQDDGNDAEITLRVMGVLRAIVWNPETRERRKLPIRFMPAPKPSIRSRPSATPSWMVSAASCWQRRSTRRRTAARSIGSRPASLL